MQRCSTEKQNGNRYMAGQRGKVDAGTDRSMHGTVGKATSVDSTLVLHLLSKSPNCKRRRPHLPTRDHEKNNDFGSKKRANFRGAVVVAQAQANAKCTLKRVFLSCWPLESVPFDKKTNNL